ncbi:DDE-type integrase/transposase/recombinase [Actinomyces viscosus]|uniref:DDE-type integrase/transposase/recombinase n=1 Tax=Actinomyces viscosus TaxID=1656 RepID=UPI0038B84D1C
MTRHHSSSLRGPRPRPSDTPPPSKRLRHPHPPTLPTPWEVPPPTSGTWAGFVYLATVLDRCTKKVVGYTMADHMRTSLVCEAIDMAVRRCPVEKGVTVFPLRPGQPVHEGYSGACMGV